MYTHEKYTRISFKTCQGCWLCERVCVCGWLELSSPSSVHLMPETDDHVANDEKSVPPTRQIYLLMFV